jgi:hypothetical protein
MAQSSAPIVNENLSDIDWRDLFGDEPGVVGDMDGTAYKLTLPTNSDIVSVGSASQASLARVAGFVHRIDAGDTEGITIPAASGASRTDIVALRYSAAHTGEPGPVRLVRINGTSTAIPTYDASPPGVEDLPLWAITRAPGQALSQATVVRLFPRLAPSLGVAPTAPLPLNAPLDTIVRRHRAIYRRELGSTQVPVWVRQVETRSRLLPIAAFGKLAGFVDLTAPQVLPAAPFGFGAPYRLTMSARVKITLPSGLGARLELLVNGVVAGGAEFSNGGSQTMLFKTLEVNDTILVGDDAARTVRARLTSLAGEIIVDTTYGRVYIEATPYEAL